MARPSRAKKLYFTDTELEQPLALMDPHVGISIAILAITARLDVVVARALSATSLELTTDTSIPRGERIAASNQMGRRSAISREF